MAKQGLGHNSIGHWRCFPQLPALTSLHVQGNQISSWQGFIVNAQQRVGKSKGRGSGASKSKKSSTSKGIDSRRTDKPSRVALFQRIDLLDLRENNLGEIRGLEALGPDYCADLSELSLLGNPICERLNYEANLLKRVPQLALLDGRSTQATAPDVLSLDSSGPAATTGSRPSTALAQKRSARPTSPRGRLPSPRGLSTRSG